MQGYRQSAEQLSSEVTANRESAVKCRAAVEEKRSEKAAIQSELQETSRAITVNASKQDENGANISENKKCTEEHRKKRDMFRECVPRCFESYAACLAGQLLRRAATISTC